MKFVTFTNAVSELHGQPIAIDTDIIVSIYPGTITEDDGTVKQYTELFTNTDMFWRVTESFDQVIKLIKSRK